MDALQFAYWLQGFSELNSDPPTIEQWASIREHLSLVFKKVTPAIIPWTVPKSPTDSSQILQPLKADCFVQCATDDKNVKWRLDPLGDGQTWIAG